MSTTRSASSRSVGRRWAAVLTASVLLASGLSHGSAAAEGRQTVPGASGRLGVSLKTLRGALDPAKVTMGWRPVYHEHEFARRRALTARPESVVVVSLEAPHSRHRGPEDSGGRPGVDAIPYHYPTTEEREFCWDGGTLFAAAPGAQPHVMVLRDARQRAVLRIEEGGPCVARVVPAGRYTMRLEAASDRGEAPDLVFIRPAGERAPVPAPPLPLEPEAPGPEASGVVCDGPVPQSDGSLLVACSQPLCTFAVNPAVAKADLPGIRDALTPGQMVFVFLGTGSYLSVFVDSPCENLVAVRDGSSFINWPLFDYQFSLFPPDPQTAAYYYYNEANFSGPRAQLDTGDCLCQGQGCRDCSIRGESLDDPVWYYFSCLLQGFCDRFGVVDSSASLSIYNPQAPPDANILLSTKTCDDCVFAFSNALRGQDLRGASVQRSDFSQADLTGTALDGIHGEGALFHSVIAPGATFPGAHLADAMFTPLLVLIAGGSPDADSIAVYPPSRLDGADLSGAELARADLSLAVLSSLLPPAPGATTCTLPDGTGPATLDGILAKEARFDGARLTGVPLTAADLRQASFRSAQAYAADFGPDGETSTMLGGADFARADLSCANLEDAQGDPADGPISFREAKMSRAFLQYASLPQAIFSGAQLDPANLAFANLMGANFAPRVIETPAGNVSLPAANLEGSYMEGTILASADLTEAKMDGVAWFERNDPEDGCQGRPCATGVGAILAAAIVQDARLPHLTLSSTATMMPGITLSGSSLSGAVLEGADLGPQGINQSILAGVDLRAAKLTGASFVNVDLSGALVQPQTEEGVFGVSVPLDPGRYTASVSTRCVHINKTATSTPVTGPLTTCPNGSTAGGCGTIGPLNGLWVRDPPFPPPIPDC